MILITIDSELQAIFPAIKASTEVSLDTEFERRTTFFPKPALLQIELNNESYLIDPVSCSDFDGLFSALSETTVLMHACREDLEVFRIMSKVRIGDFFDTQIAASLAGFDSQISYQNLVYELLGVELSKAETCSDWLQRPLSQEQCQYAADDVVYLERVNSILRSKLEELGRLDWYQEEMRFLRSLTEEPAIDDYFYKMKGLGRLTQKQLEIAYELVLWRDGLAKGKNIPRGFIIKDKGLQQIIKSFGDHEINKKLLYKLEDVQDSFVRRYADTIFALIEKGPSGSADSQKAISQTLRHLPDSSKKVKKELKQYRDSLLDQFNIKAEVLFSNRLLDQCLDALYFDVNDEWSSEQFDTCFESILNAWRYNIFKPKLLEISKAI